MAAAWACRVTKLASTIMRPSSTQQPNTGQYVRRWTAEYLVPHRRCYATYSGRDIKTGAYDYDLAVSTAIEEYTKQEQIIKEDGMVYYPLKGTSGGLNMNMEDDDDYGMEYPLKAMVRQRINRGLKIKEDGLLYPLVCPLSGQRRCFGDLKMFLIVLKTILGEKYASLCLAPDSNDDESVEPPEAMKLVLFRKLDRKVPFFFDRVISDKILGMSPSDPRIMAAASFALARHNENEKLVQVIKASSQMISEYEVLRMRFEGELGEHEAIVLVPCNVNNPEDMELVLFRNDDCSKFNQAMFSSTQYNMSHRHRNYKYDDRSGECYASMDDSEFALSVMRTKFAVWLKDYLYGYIECWHKDPEDHDYVADRPHSEDEDDEPVVGSDECSPDDPDVIAAARYALSLNKENEKIRRVIKAFSVNIIPTNRTLRIIFEGESRWYDVTVLVHRDITNPEENMTVAQLGQGSEDCCSADELGCASFMLELVRGFEYDIPPYENNTKFERCVEAFKSWPRKPRKRRRSRNERRLT